MNKMDAIKNKSYVYITHNCRKTFDVERSPPCSDSGIATIKSFKRFNNAKRFGENLINNYEQQRRIDMKELLL